MICSNCQSEATHIQVNWGIESCPSCSSLKESRLTDDLLTRNASRIRVEALKYEGDTLPPERYDKASKKVVPNEEFLKRNKERAKNFFSADTLNKQGYNKLTTKIKKFDASVKKDAADFKKDVEHHGESSQRVKELLK